MALPGMTVLRTLLLGDPLFLAASALRIAASPSVLARLVRRNSGDLPLRYYRLGGRLILRYSELDFRSGGSGITCLDRQALEKLLARDHGPGYKDRSVVKWCSLLYAICRLAAPRTVVETGVFWGYSSIHILAALERNGRGSLHSLDVTPERLLSRGLESGVAIPDRLRRRWDITIGESALALPGLLDRLGRIDIFVHDSEHTDENMLFEYRTAWPHIREGGLLISHDVGQEDSPFSEFAREAGAACLIRDFVGIALKA
ncbi:class I SAM-dependent methyltransferase [Candidatus Fermentibacterales bacterium]|nr:class I SAM-dependent methyltransferase [Candidatus Fermentibacterales bacterium]